MRVREMPPNLECRDVAPETQRKRGPGWTRSLGLFDTLLGTSYSLPEGADVLEQTSTGGLVASLTMMGYAPHPRGALSTLVVKVGALVGGRVLCPQIPESAVKRIRHTSDSQDNTLALA